MKNFKCSFRYKLLSFKLITSLLVLTLLSGLSSKAQQDDFGWRISAGFGYTNYYGDLSHYKISLKNAGNIFKLFHLNTSNASVSNLNNSILNSYSFSCERKWTNTIGVIIQYSHNTIYGNDRTDLNGNLNPSNLNFARALNFKSNLDNVFLGLVLRTDNDHILRSTSFIAPYLTLVAGYTFFNPKADLYDASGNPYNYSTDGIIAGGVGPDGVYETSLQPLMTESDKYESRTLNAGLGLGIRFRITSRFGIHAESALNYTFTDHLDDVSGNYPTNYQNAKQEYASNPTGVVRTVRGSSAINDFFVYHSISLRFSFGAAKKKLYKVPVFNPDIYLNQSEQPAVKTTQDTVALDLTTIQDSSAQPTQNLPVTYTESLDGDVENIAPTTGKDYEIRILKKDSINSKTTITIGSGSIINISNENSDVIIQGNLKESKLIITQNNDSLEFKMPGTTKVSENNIAGDSIALATIQEHLNKQNILENQLDEKLQAIILKNEIFQTKIDSLSKVNEDQKEYFMKRIEALELKISGRAEATMMQAEKEKPLGEQLEPESKFISARGKNKPDSINQPYPEINYQQDSLSYKKLNEEVGKETDANTKINETQQEEIQRLSMQIDAQNKVFSEKLMQLQQQNNEIKADKETLEYQESLRRIQEVNNMRTTQPTMDSLLQQEFNKLSLQIQNYENERMTGTIPDVPDTFKINQNIILNDSIRRLQSELMEIKNQPVEIIEQPADTITMVQTIDVELIPVVEIFFELGSAAVSPSEETKIKDIARLLNNYPESKVILTGMADAIGNSDRNLELSLQRADYIKKLLIEKFSIDSDRIKTDSIGSERSTGENALDRKVIMRLVTSF